MRKALPSPAAVFVVLLLLVTGGLPALAAGPTVITIPDADFDRQSVFDKAVQQQEKRAAEAPDDPESWHRLAAIYAEKAQKDAKLPRDLAKQHVLRGLAVNERALTINPVYYEALRLKSILLRQRALYEDDPSLRKRLIAEADAASAKAAELLKRQRIGRAFGCPAIQRVGYGASGLPVAATAYERVTSVAVIEPPPGLLASD
jgi:hypothetical protein